MQITFVTGPACSGKTTYINDKFPNDVPVIYIGTIVRALATKWGCKVEDLIDPQTFLCKLELDVRSGLIELIETAREKGHGHVIVDGFPRSTDQMHFILCYLPVDKFNIDIHDLDVDTDVLKERMLQRGRHSDNETRLMMEQGRFIRMREYIRQLKLSTDRHGAKLPFHPNYQLINN